MISWITKRSGKVISLVSLCAFSFSGLSLAAAPVLSKGQGPASQPQKEVPALSSVKVESGRPAVVEKQFASVTDLAHAAQDSPLSRAVVTKKIQGVISPLPSQAKVLPPEKPETKKVPSKPASVQTVNTQSSKSGIVDVQKFITYATDAKRLLNQEMNLVYSNWYGKTLTSLSHGLSFLGKAQDTIDAIGNTSTLVLLADKAMEAGIAIDGFEPIMNAEEAHTNATIIMTIETPAALKEFYSIPANRGLKSRIASDGALRAAALIYYAQISEIDLMLEAAYQALANIS